jgi:uncharacterized repeat protein (TIGR02059 family)
MRRILFICLLINSSVLFAQTVLTIQGTSVNNTDATSWNGVNIQRSARTTFVFQNNYINSVNESGYQLQAGDEGEGGNNNNLDGEVISGNKLVWSGSSTTSITHGIFTGYNINAVIKYNYLLNSPMAIIRKSNGMTNTSGGVAYNIVNNPVACAGVQKGMNNVNWFNNTFYSNRSAWRGLIEIYGNDSFTPYRFSQGAKIMNNIFYTVNQVYNIAVEEAEDLVGFESDYNVFYCEAGTPVFNYLGTKKTFAEWQALGFDTHSVVVNPNFNNFTDFVPATRLNYGKDLGSAWQTGLSTTATWVVGSSPATTNQNGTWQVGARVYESVSTAPIPAYVSSVAENTTPSVITMTYSMTLANVVPAASAFSVLVNSASRPVSAVAISGTKVQLTLTNAIHFGEIVTVTYTKPASNPLQTSAGGVASSISAQSVTNNIQNPVVQPSPVTVKMTIFPNHVYKSLIISLAYTGNISVLATAALPEIIRITDTSGKLYSEIVVNTGVANIRIPLNLNSGVYIVKVIAGGLELASQKIIVY